MQKLLVYFTSRISAAILLVAVTTLPVLAQTSTGDFGTEKFTPCHITETQASDPASAVGCVRTCFSALNAAASHSVDFRRMTTLALWFALVTALVLVGLAQPWVARKAGKAGWSGTRRLLAQCGVLVAGAAVAGGAGFGLYLQLAMPHGEMAYRDLLTMKAAKVVGNAYNDGFEMTCNSKYVFGHTWEDNDVANSVRTYRGVIQPIAQFAVNPGTIDWVSAKPAVDDMTDAMGAVDRIDLNKNPVTGPVRTDVGPIAATREHSPFPWSFPLAGLMGGIAGIGMGLAIHVITKGHRSRG